MARGLALALCLLAAAAAWPVGPDTEILYDGLEYFTLVSDGIRIRDADPKIRERADTLYYEMPTARANAQLLSRDEALTSRWKVGFVQVLVQSESRMDYGLGYTEWLQPSLPVNDSDDTEYPWYAGSEGWRRGRGTVHLWFGDSPSSTMSWRYTFRDGGVRETAGLRGVTRDQSFHVFLCALDEANDTLHVIKTYFWRFRLELAVDIGKPLGERCAIRSFAKECGASDGPLPLSAEGLLPPCANVAQEFTVRYQAARSTENGN